MINEVVNKLKDEMSKNNNPYIKIIGEFLLQYLNTNPGEAEKIMQTDKTIAKSLDAMKEAAKKKQVGGCAVLTEQEGFEIVLKYFGINRQAPAAVIDFKEKVNQMHGIKEEQPKKADIDFNVSLDDFLV